MRKFLRKRIYFTVLVRLFYGHALHKCKIAIHCGLNVGVSVLEEPRISFYSLQPDRFSGPPNWHGVKVAGSWSWRRPCTPSSYISCVCRRKFPQQLLLPVSAFQTVRFHNEFCVVHFNSYVGFPPLLPGANQCCIFFLNTCSSIRSSGHGVPRSTPTTSYTFTFSIFHSSYWFILYAQIRKVITTA